jgi:hypothetical protein
MSDRSNPLAVATERNLGARRVLLPVAGAVTAFSIVATTVFAAILANATITWTLLPPPSPALVEISTGESVTWQGDLVTHPLIATNASFSTFGGIEANSGTSHTKSFPDPGTYYFMCGVHGAAMPTTVTVTCPPGPYATLDVDGNGSVDAMTDGVLIIRYVLGNRGDALIAGAVGPCASRATAGDIESYLATLVQ